MVRPMNAEPVSPPPHADALAAVDRVTAALARRGWLFGLLRLGAVLLTVVAVGAFIAQPGAPRFAAIIACGAGVLVLGLVQQSVDDRRRQSEARANYHRRGLDRCTDRWSGGPVTTAPANHPYAHDLDLVGANGLLSRLGSDLSPGGVQQLTTWALDDESPVDPGRAPAVQALARSHEWRARLAAAASGSDDTARIAALAQALEGFQAPGMGLKLLGWALRLSAIGGIIAAGVIGGLDMAFWSLLGAAAVLAPLDLAIASRFAALGDSDRLRPALAALANGMAVAADLAQESEPHLQALGRRCAEAQDGARRLAHHLAAISQRRDPLWTFLVCGPLQLATREAAGLDRWKRQHGQHLSEWCRDLAEAESLAALATWAAEQGGCWPTWSDDGPLIEAKQLAHPLLARSKRTGNDLTLQAGAVWMITGANASGKSTWLRSCALAVVLARLGTTVPAISLRLRPMRIAATMRAGDDIAAGLSRFQAEVASLARAWKRVGEPGAPLLLVLDEILAGTNSHERHLACRALLERLAGSTGATLVSTHDLSLATLAETHPQSVQLGHFADSAAVGSDDLQFDYRLRSGVTRSTNALTVLRRAGIPISDHGN